ncbi:MAG: hypothetical protein ACE366_15515 [Bradymonadia bacterium]
MHATATPDLDTTPTQAPPSDGAWSALGLIDDLLRNRTAALNTLEDPATTAQSARTLVTTIILGTGVLGATLGMYRGGWQVLYAAVKLPLVVLLTAGFCTPAFSAMQAALHGRTRIRRDLLVVLGTLALSSMLGAACAPLLMLAMSVQVNYHTLTLLTVMCCAVAGAGGLTFFFGALKRWVGSRQKLMALTLFLVFSSVGSQMTWTLRPFLVRPRTVEVPFVRGIEGGFVDAVLQSLDSAQGRYRRGAAPLPDAEYDRSEQWRQERREDAR